VIPRTCSASATLTATCLPLSGHWRVIEELAEINFRTGGNWNEQAAGTNAVGTTLAEGRSVQIVVTEHYVHAWQRGVCTAAPIRHPLSGEIIAVIDVTSYKEAVQPHTLLAVYSTATLIETAAAA
jgi:sigma-54 dependent transcriptional regulator, acetoin dehydrogenase operon transcriptional activator AcoR